MKQRALRALMLLLSFSLLVVTCPVKKWLYADNSTAVPAAARTHQTGIRLGAHREQTSSSACVQLQRAEVSPTSVLITPLKKPVAFLHYDISSARGAALCYFLSGLPLACRLHPKDRIPSLPLYLELRTLLI